MDSIKGIRILSVVALFAASLSYVVTPAYAEQIWFENATMEVDLEGKLDLLVVAESNDGSVVVRGKDRGSVEITIERFDPGDPRLNRARVDLDLEQGVLNLKLLNKLVKSNLVLVVPRSVSLRLRVIDGDVRVDGIAGEIEVNAVDGDVLLTEVSGGIVANSVDGSVEVKMVDGAFVSPVSLATVDGDVLLEAGVDFDANFSVSTIDGSFVCDYEYRVDRKSGGWRKFVGVSLSGKLGDGGPPISLRTIDGDVRIKRRD